MKLETAMKVLKKESEWLGMKMPDLLEDIANNRYMIYSARVVEAYDVYITLRG